MSVSKHRPSSPGEKKCPRSSSESLCHLSTMSKMHATSSGSCSQPINMSTPKASLQNIFLRYWNSLRSVPGKRNLKTLAIFKWHKGWKCFNFKIHLAQWNKNNQLIVVTDVRNSTNNFRGLCYHLVCLSPTFRIANCITTPLRGAVKMLQYICTSLKHRFFNMEKNKNDVSPPLLT